MPVRLCFERYSPDLCAAAPEDVFLFGDNLARAGKGGQAVVRDMPNAVGLPTKHRPARDAAAYLTDADRPAVIAAIKTAHVAHVLPALRAGRVVHWPADGIGTGLADLRRLAPGCYADVSRYGQILFERAGDVRHATFLVCGGRDYADRDTLDREMSRFVTPHLEAGDDVEIIHGAARGADTLAGDWAGARGLTVTPVPADWNRYGAKRAGFLRNTEMAVRLSSRRDQANVRTAVLGFPGGPGTRMMLDIAKSFGFERHAVGVSGVQPDLL